MSSSVQHTQPMLSRGTPVKGITCQNSLVSLNNRDKFTERFFCFDMIKSNVFLREDLKLSDALALYSPLCATGIESKDFVFFVVTRHIFDNKMSNVHIYASLRLLGESLKYQEHPCIIQAKYKLAV